MINQLKSEIQLKLLELQNLNESDLIEKNEDIKAMINYYNALTEKVEDRRTRIYEFTMQYLVFLIAVISILASIYSKINIWFLCPLVSIIIAQIICSIYTLYVYEYQSNFKFVFKSNTLQDFSNRWKWFYYGNPNITNINTNKSKIDDFSIEAYLKGMNLFINNYIDEDLKSEVTDNIHQLYLLQVHNYYKNRFLAQLVDIRLNSFFYTLLFIMLGVIVASLLSIKTLLN